MLYNTTSMANLKQQILKIASEKPKNFSTIVKNTPELMQAITGCQGDSISEKSYNFIFETATECQHGNRKKFKSFKEGYVNCGRAADCQCTRDAVSSKVSARKLHYSEEQKKEIQEKRIATTIEKYGVSNTGQTEHARKKHSEFYTDSEKIKTVNDRIANTKLTRYGNATFNNSKKIKETWKEKSLTFWIATYRDKNLTLLHNKELLSQAYNTCSVEEIAQTCNVHEQTVYRYLIQHGLREPFKSSGEKEIINFLNSIGISNIVTNSRKIIESGKEIDIYLPDFKLAIEYNGVYWHHEDVPHITKTYHLDKFIECEKKGIQLITVFSNFWKSKPEIVKQMLINKLGINNSKIYARCCQIKATATSECREFLNKNHIQGYATSSFNYGLYHKNNLVALMTFGKTRVGIGRKEEGVELIRFASSCRVVGGASKLLSHFIKQHRPLKIISYSNNEWSTGNLYLKLGFVLEHTIPVSYWYLEPKKEVLLHRYSFAKHKLLEKGYDATLSEREITKQMGLMKVWDCGKKRWVLDCCKKQEK